MSEWPWWQIAPVILAGLFVLSVIGGFAEEIRDRLVTSVMGWRVSRDPFTQAIYSGVRLTPIDHDIEIALSSGVPMTPEYRDKLAAHLKKCAEVGIQKYVDSLP